MSIDKFCALHAGLQQGEQARALRNCKLHWCDPHTGQISAQQQEALAATGQYRTIKKLGAGTYGQVVVAKHIDTGELVSPCIAVHRLIGEKRFS